MLLADLLEGAGDSAFDIAECGADPLEGPIEDVALTGADNWHVGAAGIDNAPERAIAVADDHRSGLADAPRQLRDPLLLKPLHGS